MWELVPRLANFLDWQVWERDYIATWIGAVVNYNYKKPFSKALWLVAVELEAISYWGAITVVWVLLHDYYT